MIYNYTRCESVIAKIMADLDSTEVNNRISDIKEWIFEAVDKIGAPMQYISKESGEDSPVLEIHDRQVPVPPDLQILDGVAYSDNPDGPWVPVSPMTGIFKNTKKHKPDTHHGPFPEKLPTAQSQLYNTTDYKYWKEVLLNDKLNRPEYFIKPGWIVTNRDKGFIKLAYKAIATDERGYPLIPDTSSYQEAVYWYVVMKMTFPKFMSGALGGNSKYSHKYAQQTYYYVQQQWNFYRNQAYAEAMMPTADDMRNIKNQWNKLIPEWDADDTFFKHIGKEQDVYTDYYYGY